MTAWYDNGFESGYISIKQGEERILNVKSIEKREDISPQFQVKNKQGQSLGWALILTTTDNKQMTINAFCLIGALRKAKIDAGDKIRLYHRGRGDYEVEKLGTAEQPKTETEQEEAPF